MKQLFTFLVIACFLLCSSLPDAAAASDSQTPQQPSSATAPATPSNQHLILVSIGTICLMAFAYHHREKGVRESASLKRYKESGSSMESEDPSSKLRWI